MYHAVVSRRAGVSPARAPAGPQNGHTGVAVRRRRCGGGDARGRHAAARSTFWNVRARQPQAWPPADFGPDLMNLAAVESDRPAETAGGGRWFEPIPPRDLTPQDPHRAQLDRRPKRD